MVAYHWGKAANVAPPAVSSQTSLPSQVLPMLLMMARRSSSFFPRKRISMPTPKSKPSRKKNPIQRTAMRMNQSVCRNSCDIAFSSVLRTHHGRHTLSRFGTCMRRPHSCSGVFSDQVNVSHSQRAIHQREADEADQEVDGRQVWRDGLVDG